MEKDRNPDDGHRDKDRWPDSDAAERHATSNDSYLGINKDVSGNDEEETQRNITHHQQFGNRHYKSYSNHSSADDQPTTDTGA